MYNISIIGAGNISSGYDSLESQAILTHAHAILDSQDFNLAGFYDVDIKKSKMAAEKWKCQCFEDLNTAVVSSDIICIAVPDEYHANVLEQLLDYRHLKAIIMEKPFTASLVEAERMVITLENRKIPFLLNYSRRYMEEFHSMKEWIEEHAGALICANFYYGKGLLHNGSHFVDVIRYLLGEFSVLSVYEKCVDLSGDDISYGFIARLWDKGGHIFFHPIDCSIATIFEMDLLFEKGRVKYSDDDGTIEYYDVLRENPLFDEQNYSKVLTVQIDRSSAMRGLYSNLLRVIDSTARPGCSYMDGLATLRIVDELRNNNGRDMKFG